MHRRRASAQPSVGASAKSPGRRAISSTSVQIARHPRGRPRIPHPARRAPAARRRRRAGTRCPPHRCAPRRQRRAQRGEQGGHQHGREADDGHAGAGEGAVDRGPLDRPGIGRRRRSRASSRSRRRAAARRARGSGARRSAAARLPRPRGDAPAARSSARRTPPTRSRRRARRRRRSAGASRRRSRRSRRRCRRAPPAPTPSRRARAGATSVAAIPTPNAIVTCPLGKLFSYMRPSISRSGRVSTCLSTCVVITAPPIVVPATIAKRDPPAQQRLRDQHQHRQRERADRDRRQQLLGGVVRGRRRQRAPVEGALVDPLPAIRPHQQCVRDRDRAGAAGGRARAGEAAEAAHRSPG